jgi:hypothetical protein
MAQVVAGLAGMLESLATERQASPRLAAAGRCAPEGEDPQRWRPGFATLPQRHDLVDWRRRAAVTTPARAPASR